MNLVEVSCEVPGYRVYATGVQNDQAWIVFTVIWFDIRCGVSRQKQISGYSVPAGQT